MTAPALYSDDHTNIMKAILDHAYEIAKLSDNEAPAFRQVLEMMHKSEKVDQNTRRAIGTVLVIMSKLEETRDQNIPMDAMKVISEALSQCQNPDQMIGALKTLSLDKYLNTFPDVRDGLFHAVNLLIAGSESIYKVEYYDSKKFANLQDGQEVELRGSLRNSLKQYAKVDVEGAISAVPLKAAIVLIIEPTSFITVVGTTAAYGAINASGKKLVHSIWNRLRGKKE
jgi:hypothetical protein